MKTFFLRLTTVCLLIITQSISLAQTAVDGAKEVVDNVKDSATLDTWYQQPWIWIVAIIVIILIILAIFRGGGSKTPKPQHRSD